LTGEAVVVLLSVTLMVVAGLGVLWIAVTNRRATREMEHRERLAMIQRGLIPAPEADPLGFEAATMTALAPPSHRSERWRTAGVLCIGLGLALMMMLVFTAHEIGNGIGIGGAFVVLGGTLVVNASQIAKSETRRHYTVRSGPPPPESPSNVAP
jgi:hypothetical protein